MKILMIHRGAEGRDLGALDGADQAELRLDHAGMRGVSAELRADRLVQVDHVLHGEVTHPAVSQ